MPLFSTSARTSSSACASAAPLQNDQGTLCALQDIQRALDQRGRDLAGAASITLTSDCASLGVHHLAESLAGGSR